jgi:hypothetical protein
VSTVKYCLEATEEGGEEKTFTREGGRRGREGFIDVPGWMASWLNDMASEDFVPECHVCRWTLPGMHMVFEPWRETCCQLRDKPEVNGELKSIM